MSPVGTASAVTTPADAARLGTVLGLWAHPDDETFLSAGLMSLTRAAGGRVALVHATAGEHGTDDPTRWPPRRLARTRAREVREALRILDVRERSRSLGLPDGGCADVDDSFAVAQFARSIEVVQPDTIVTFGPDGITGHPDHVAVARWAERAWDRTGRTARLLQVANSEAKAAEFADVYAAVGIGALGDVATRPTGEIALEVRLDDGFAERKLRALLAHGTQMAPIVDRIGADALREWWRIEPFAEVNP